LSCIAIPCRLVNGTGGGNGGQGAGQAGHQRTSTPPERQQGWLRASATKDFVRNYDFVAGVSADPAWISGVVSPSGASMRSRTTLGVLLVTRDESIL
jgi:hypothetical protein